MAKDYTKYTVEGIEGSYNKARLVQVIINNHATRENTTWETLFVDFPNELQGSAGVIAKKEAVKRERDFYIDAPIMLKDGTEIVTCRQWGKDNIQRFITNAKTLGYTIHIAKEEAIKVVETATTSDEMASNKQLTQIAVDWKYEHYIEQIRRTFHVKKNKKHFRVKKHENYVVTALLHDERLRVLKPLTQHYVPLSNGQYALIDLYYPQINLAIEVDEPFHSDNQDADTQRQEGIEALMECDFERIDIEEGDVMGQVKKLQEKLLTKLKEQQARGTFESWKPVEVLDIEVAKEKYKNTLFVKIKGEIPPEDLQRRQTGRWPLAAKKMPFVKQVIVVHDRVISRVFKNPVFSRYAEDNKFLYTGEEDTSNSILGNKITNWEYQITWTYSKDIEATVKRKKK